MTDRYEELRKALEADDPWDSLMGLPDEPLDTIRALLAERDALEQERNEDQGVIAVWRGRCERAEAERDALERDRDSWEKQASDRVDDAVRLIQERDALRAAIDAHNRGCDGQCEWRQQNGSWAALCADYKSRGQSCPDCPRDNRIDAAISSEGE